MSKDRTWTAWTFLLGDKAYKCVRPLYMELVREKQTLESSGMLWWRKTVEEYTGRWTIKFKYDRGPATRSRVDFIYFNTENQARFWFDQTWQSVFLGRKQPIGPKWKKPQPKKKNKPNLRLL